MIFRTKNKTPKKKTCKNCKVKFQPEREMIEPICSYECAIQVLKKRKEKAIKKEQKEWHEKNDKLSVFQKRLETQINSIVRLIDYGQPCVSCQKFPKKPQAGHYHSVNSNGTLRFHLHNIHLQCYSCNGEKGANIIGYNKGLTMQYGKGYKEYVESDIVAETKTIKLSRIELTELTAKASAIRKDLEQNKTPLSYEMRLSLRTRINNELSIYKFN
jgi:hypothetical protein